MSTGYGPASASGYASSVSRLPAWQHSSYSTGYQSPTSSDFDYLSSSMYKSAQCPPVNSVGFSIDYRHSLSSLRSRGASKQPVGAGGRGFAKTTANGRDSFVGGWSSGLAGSNMNYQPRYGGGMTPGELLIFLIREKKIHIARVWRPFILF